MVSAPINQGSIRARPGAARRVVTVTPRTHARRDGGRGMSVSGRRCSAFTATLLALAWSASAQIATGTVTGTVTDQSGGTVPGATVVLLSESQGTKLAPQVTNTNGIYVFAG